jgi:hypothetical protein
MQTPDFLRHLQTSIAYDDLDAVLSQLQQLLANSPQLDAALKQSPRWQAIRQQIQLGVVDHVESSLERGEIRAALLDLLREMGQGSLSKNSTMISGSKNVVSGSNISTGGNVHIGDVIGRDKINRQINVGVNYAENQALASHSSPTPPSRQERDAPKSGLTEEKHPDTPAGFFGMLFKYLPQKTKPIVALLLVLGIAYGAYRHFLPAQEAALPPTLTEAEPAQEKIYVSGRLRVNNAEPKPLEIKRLVIKDMPSVNSTTLDAAGKFTFSEVVIPPNKKLRIEVTFADGTILPTEEISVGQANPENHTIDLPDLYAERPKPARNSKPAQGWSLTIINQNTSSSNSSTGD